MAVQKRKENPGKRSAPPQTAEIIKDMRKRLPQDSEDQASINRRTGVPLPRRRGASQSGFRKNNSPV